MPPKCQRTVAHKKFLHHYTVLNQDFFTPESLYTRRFYAAKVCNPLQQKVLTSGKGSHMFPLSNVCLATDSQSGDRNLNPCATYHRPPLPSHVHNMLGGNTGIPPQDQLRKLGSGGVHDAYASLAGFRFL